MGVFENSIVITIETQKTNSYEIKNLHYRSYFQYCSI